MSWTCLTLVTVLFGVICGNRFVDKSLLRSSSTYTGAFKSLNDLNTDSLNNKLNVDTKSKSLDTNANAKLLDVPCGSEFNYKHAKTVRNCNDNFVSLLKTPSNYITYENDDSTPTLRESYQPVRDFDDIFDVATPIDINEANLLRPVLSSLPLANYKDFFTDLVVDTSAKEEMMKRSGNTIGSSLGTPSARGCECKVRNDLVDLGQHYYPRYLLNAVCQSEQSRHQLGPKCWSGAICRPLEYKVKVLTFRTLVDNMQNDPTLAWLPDDLRQIWKFKTVTITAGCFCS